jgi:hypothetical protein
MSPVITDRISGRLSFKESPFFTILTPLTSVMECKGIHCSLHTLPVTYSRINLANMYQSVNRQGIVWSSRSS